MNLFIKAIIGFVMSIVVGVALLIGKSTRPETTESFCALLEAEQITVYRALASGRQDGKIVDIVGDVLYRTDKQDEVDEIISMFDGWDMESNKVPLEEILNLDCDIYVCFEGAMTLTGSAFCGGGIHCYGTVEGIPYYLPEAFGEFLVSLVRNTD